jgi:hypothetical protein
VFDYRHATVDRLIRADKQQRTVIDKFSDSRVERSIQPDAGGTALQNPDPVTRDYGCPGLLNQAG